MTRTTHLAFAILLALGLPAAHATPPLDQIGTLSYSCAGKTNGNAYLGIQQETNFYAGQFKCREAFDPLMGKVSSKTSYATPTDGSGSTRGIARMGMLKAVSANAAVLGIASRTIVGFNDDMIFTAPGRTGQVEVTFRYKVGGTIDAHGPSGAASLLLMTTLDTGALAQKVWSVSTDIWAPDATQEIAETVDLTLSASLGVTRHWSHLLTLANGTRGVGGTGHGSSTAKQPGAVWMGIVGVKQNGVDLSDWSLQSGSGIDWRQPCPCALP